MTIKDIYYDSSGGRARIHARLWAPDGEAIGVVQIFHGISEHSGRYDHFAKYLVRQGFAVLGSDHMGHGGSLVDGELYGCVSGSWDALCRDCLILSDFARRSFSGRPLFWLAHSMGSFIARTLLIDHPGMSLSGCLLLGSGWMPTATVSLGAELAQNALKKSGDEDVHAPELADFIMGGFNRRFAPARTDFDWMCSDSSVVDDFIKDPKTAHPIRLSLGAALFSGIAKIQKRDELAKMAKTIPVGFFSGGDDPVGDMGKGVRRAAKAMIDAGLLDVSMRIYPGMRHEILNETGKKEVYNDILGWIYSKMA